MLVDREKNRIMLLTTLPSQTQPTIYTNRMLCNSLLKCQYFQLNILITIHYVVLWAVAMRLRVNVCVLYGLCALSTWNKCYTPLKIIKTELIRNIKLTVYDGDAAITFGIWPEIGEFYLEVCMCCVCVCVCAHRKKNVRNSIERA